MLLVALTVAFAPTGALPGPATQDTSASRLPRPEDRYAMAGGCYVVRALATDAYLVRDGAGFLAATPDLAGAEPFHFQATDLGRYLLYGTKEDFLAADEGIVARATSDLADSQAGQIADGVTGGATGQALAGLAAALGPATGLGGAVVAADEASALADWEIEQVALDTFTIALPALSGFLAVGDGGALVLSETSDESGRFGFQLTEGCAAFPEIEVNVEGAPHTGDTPYEEVAGFLDAHVHMMAFEFIGGRVRWNLHDDGGTPEGVTGRDSLVAGVFRVAGQTGAAPIYPPGPHCNSRALSPLGAHMIRRMIDKGIVFDPDHMSARARTQAMDIIREEGAPGVVSSHSWADITIYPRVLEAGGVVTPYAGGSKGFFERWAAYRAWADPRYTFGFGYGSDVNGFGSQGGPRTDAPVEVSYPFTGFGGVTVHQQRSGQRVYDINVDGVAHYGLYPDWIEELRLQGGEAIIGDMARAAEAYLQMWERTVGVAPNACRTDVPDLTDGAVSTVTLGMTPEQVLVTLGQPSSREDTRFTYCMTGARTATITFAPSGGVAAVSIA